jgi:predicted secreted hydrolase
LDQTGWDWLALQLDDGREVVAYRLRAAGEEGGGPLAYAALVPERPDEAAPGRLRVLDLDGARLEVTDRWTSPASGAVYPAGWRLHLPAADLVLDVEPLLADQELDLAVRYWEGAVAVRGTTGGRPVAGRGYAELTGYGEAAGRVR